MNRSTQKILGVPIVAWVALLIIGESMLCGSILLHTHLSEDQRGSTVTPEQALLVKGAH